MRLGVLVVPVALTQPVGLILIATIENQTTATFREGIKKMFGTLASRGLRISQFTSDNEKGIGKLARDMAAMKVQVTTVGPGQHDHTIERLIRHLKETIRATIFSIPYCLPDVLMPHLVLSAGKRMLLFLSATRSDRVSPFEAFFGRIYYYN